MSGSGCGNVNDDPLNNLVRGFLDGTLNEAELQRLSSELQQDGSQVAALVQAAMIDESLVAHYRRQHEEAIRRYLLAFARIDETCPVDAEEAVLAQATAATPDRKSRRSWATAVIAASLLLAAGFYFSRPRDVAMVTQLAGARMSDGEALHVGARVREGQRLEIAEGFVELTFDRGTVVAIKGPADFEVVNDLRAKSRRGRITVEVGERSTGFTVETPSANIVDWGTQFGVGVDGEETDIVVFDGIVDLHARGTSGDLQKPKRLTQGEGLRVSRDGALHRIMSVSGTEFPTPRLGNIVATSAPVIESVKDNVRDGATNKYYRIIYGGFKEDAQAYVDRAHQWNGLTPAGLPQFLVGADYVMPFNEDKRIHRLQVTVTMAQDANVYLLYDSRASTPQWLASKFEDTGVAIGLDEGPSTTLRDWTTGVGAGVSIDTHFRVWKYKARAGEHLRLGLQRDNDPASPSGAMYAVAATAADS